MTTGFTDRLRERVDSIWEAQHRHPFVVGIGDGTLDLENLKFWVRQDYVFLIEDVRLLALAVVYPHALPPITIATGLRSEQVKQGMPIPIFVAGHTGSQYLFEDQQTHAFHRVEQGLIASHPRDVVGPAPAFDVKSRIFAA